MVRKEGIKKFFKKLVLSCFFINLFLYLISCLTPFISPQYFFPMTFLALGFPLLLLGMLFWFLASLLFKKNKSWIVFLLILLGYKNIHSTIALSFSNNNLAEKKANSFRVLSWNVKNFVNHEKNQDTLGSTYRKMMMFIKSTNADFICIQDFEQLDSSIFLHPINYIKDSLNYPYSYFSVDIDTTDKYGHSRYGTCIFSRFPIVNSGSIQYIGKKHFNESLGFADVSIRDKKVRIFNTHLRSMYLSIRDSKQFDFKYIIDDTMLVFHSTKFDKLKYFDTSHINQTKIIKTAFDTTKIPFVFCADLNSVSSSYVYSQISKNLNDAFVQKGFGWGGTYSNLFPFLRIDVVLMSKELEATKYYSPKLQLSDHYPVVTDIVFRKD
jgi:endonuclease/exonuclease/phosphatase family metal-dependent hydrolase